MPVAWPEPTTHARRGTGDSGRCRVAREFAAARPPRDLRLRTLEINGGRRADPRGCGARTPSIGRARRGTHHAFRVILQFPPKPRPLGGRNRRDLPGGRG